MVIYDITILLAASFQSTKNDEYVNWTHTGGNRPGIGSDKRTFSNALDDNPLSYWHAKIDKNVSDTVTATFKERSLPLYRNLYRIIYTPQFFNALEGVI